MMLLCMGFGLETLFLDDWPASRWFILAGVFAMIYVGMSLTVEERRKWREAHRDVFEFILESYRDRMAWVVAFYAVVLFLSYVALYYLAYSMGWIRHEQAETRESGVVTVPRNIGEKTDREIMKNRGASLRVVGRG